MSDLEIVLKYEKCRILHFLIDIDNIIIYTYMVN